MSRPTKELAKGNWKQLKDACEKPRGALPTMTPIGTRGSGSGSKATSRRRLENDEKPFERRLTRSLERRSTNSEEQAFSPAFRISGRTAWNPSDRGFSRAGRRGGTRFGTPSDTLSLDSAHDHASTSRFISPHCLFGRRLWIRGHCGNLCLDRKDSVHRFPRSLCRFVYFWPPIRRVGRDGRRTTILSLCDIVVHTEDRSGRRIVWQRSVLRPVAAGCALRLRIVRL